ncbi:MAG TPA: hypothetical protein VGX76_06390, partial [Pirellulales bacterium]|nr:hypothetical protein [Pirellulales bacterium]
MALPLLAMLSGTSILSLDVTSTGTLGSRVNGRRASKVCVAAPSRPSRVWAKAVTWYVVTESDRSKVTSRLPLGSSK